MAGERSFREVTEILDNIVRRETECVVSERERRLRAMFEEPDAGCRAVSEGTPVGGRSIFTKHEFPRARVRRLFGLRVRCYCRDLP